MQITLSNETAEVLKNVDLEAVKNVITRLIDEATKNTLISPPEEVLRLEDMIMEAMQLQILYEPLKNLCDQIK